MVSNEFSLNGYAAADRPALYFSYYLDTENDSSIAPPEIMMRDAFRVYVSDNNGDWQELATNNSYRGNGFVDDELQDLDAAYRAATEPDDKIQYFDIQEIFRTSTTGGRSAFRWTSMRAGRISACGSISARAAT